MLTRRAAKGLVPALAVAVFAAGVAGCRGDGLADAVAGSSTVATSSPSLTVMPALPARRAGAVVPEAPKQLRLPSGNVLPVRSVSARADGLLDVPDDIRTAGWWRGGSRIGDPFGATLIAAHVDSTRQGLGPYAELLSVRPRALVVVRTSHLLQRFRVRSLRLVPRGSLADASWIYAADGGRRLTLVTCAGPYVRARGGYQNLAVVTALPVGHPVARRSAR